MALRTVHLQTLEPKEFVLYADRDGPAYWAEQFYHRQLLKYYDSRDRKAKRPTEDTAPLYYRETCTRSGHGDFYRAAALAYNQHGEWVLSPDDVWMAIALWFTKFVGKHAEVLRAKFVSHEGKQQLSVVTEHETDRTQWSEFFTNVIPAIEKHTQPGVVSALQANFSTTGPLERLLSTATVMNTMKHYFSFCRIVPCCGLAAVHFLGTETDWEELLVKLDGLKAFDHEGQVAAYVDRLRPVLQQFLRTYRGDVDLDWWNRMMNERDALRGSGGATFVSGWILAFYGLEGELDASDLEMENLEVDIELCDQLRGTKEIVTLVGGFSGLNVDGRRVRPHLSMAIMPQT